MSPRPLMLLMLAGLGSFGGCRPGARSEAGAGEQAAGALSEADKAAIRATDSIFSSSATAGDVDGLVSVYADDATLLAPNLPPQRGKEAIKSFWAGFLEAYTTKFEVQSDTVEGRGDLAYDMGRYRFNALPKAKGVPGVADEGKFLTVLKKQSDGSWKLVLDMYSSNLALQH